MKPSERKYHFQLITFQAMAALYMQVIDENRMKPYERKHCFFNLEHTQLWQPCLPPSRPLALSSCPGKPVFGDDDDDSRH